MFEEEVVADRHTSSRLLGRLLLAARTIIVVIVVIIIVIPPALAIAIVIIIVVIVISAASHGSISSVVPDSLAGWEEITGFVGNVKEDVILQKPSEEWPAGCAGYADFAAEYGEEDKCKMQNRECKIQNEEAGWNFMLHFAFSVLHFAF